MKKYILLLASAVLLILSSCTKEPEDWNSVTSEFDGNWYYQVLNSDMEVVYDYDVGELLFTYNTADNVDNEIWIDDEGHQINMKFKAIMQGTTDKFTSSKEDNLYFEEAIIMPSAPDSMNSLKTVNGDYTTFEIREGKIIKGVSQMKSGNLMDSIYLKVTGYLKNLNLKSVFNSIDTTYKYSYTDSTINLDTTTIIILSDTTTIWYGQDWIKLNDTVLYKVDTLGWNYLETDKDSSIEKIDTTYKWEAIGDTTEVSEEYIISGYRKSGFEEDVR